jgi:hypothetical protein
VNNIVLDKERDAKVTFDEFRKQRIEFVDRRSGNARQPEMHAIAEQRKDKTVEHLKN